MEEPHQVSFKFHHSLNDFLSKSRQNRGFEYRFWNRPTVKDAIEALGVPHVEVFAIYVDRQPVGFDHHLISGQNIEVYDYKSCGKENLAGLFNKDPDRNKFVLDVHLGQLARYLRMLGLDTYYQNDLEDPEIIRISNRDRRIILTRDLGLLKNGKVDYGYWLRSNQPEQQLEEVMDRYQPGFNPLTRCLECNGLIQPVAKVEVEAQIPPAVQKQHQEFYRCSQCQKIYWKGSHYKRMQEFISTLKGKNNPDR